VYTTSVKNVTLSADEHLIEHARSLDPELSVGVVDALTSEERFCLVVEEVFHRDGREVIIRRANVYRVRGDEIAEIWIFEADQAEVDALLAG